MCSLEKLYDKKTQTAFNKKVISTTQHLRAYVMHRLYVAESTGIVPKNMYTANDLIDEAIAKFYEKGYDIDTEAVAIKLKMFKIIDADLDELFEKESFHKDTMSTNSILVEELDALEENFTVDEDFDFIMNEELNDISYKQDTKHKHLFLYDDSNQSILNAFEMNNLNKTHSKELLGKFYSLLPFMVSDIVDLHVFGKLTYEEVSKIKNIEVKRVQRIFKEVKKSLRKRIN